MSLRIIKGILLWTAILLILAACQPSPDEGAVESENVETFMDVLTVTGDMLITPKTDIVPSETVGNIPTMTPETNVIEWLGISEDGVDEDAFLENLDVELLKEIAAEFQALVEEVQQKQIEDPESVLRGEWYTDIIESDKYIKVVNMGDEAMKPLYWIIYKSDNQGLYEYICCMALEELSGYDFTDDNGIGWATSKDFLDRFTKRITSDKQ